MYIRLLFVLLFFITPSLLAKDIDIQKFISNKKDIMFLINPINGEIVKANKKAALFYGYSLKNLENMNIKDINAFTKKQVQDEMRKAKAEKRNHFIFNHKLKNGDIKKVVVHSYPIIFDKKRVLFSIIHEISNIQIIEEFNKNLDKQVKIQTKKLRESQDKIITIFSVSTILMLIGIIFLSYLYFQRKKLSLELTDSNEKLKEQMDEFQTIFDISNDGIAIMDLESNFLNFNEAYLRMTGYTREELLQKSCLELTVEKEQPKAKEALKEVFETGSLRNFEKSCITKNGKIITANMSISLMPDKKRLLATSKDVTQLKLLESKERLASMGEMIGNIAHQWRQPLSVISVNASAVKFKKELDLLEDEDLNNTMDSIVEQSKYLSETIDDFRAYIKNNQKRDNIKISKVLRKTLSLANASLKNNQVEVIKEINSDIEILGYENQLIQAILNILNNAKDAIKENNTDKEKLVLIKTISDEDGLMLIIHDNAGGIPENILPRIFEPYFTTKHQNLGTGIGLSLANDIFVKHHHAYIKVINDEFIYDGKKHYGAKFTITFYQD